MRRSVSTGKGFAPLLKSSIAYPPYCQDCENENFDLITESNVLPEIWQINVSYVTIKPDRNFIQRVEHNSDMDFYQFVGNLGKDCLQKLTFNHHFLVFWLYKGGILHLYLGLSAIQLYDVCYRLIFRVKTLWKMFVEL